MKRTAFFKLLLFFILHSSLLASAVAQTIGEAFYIYRNDGGFNAFFRSEIDSITYSCYDTDSVLYDDIVTQVIVTADSTYRIPLAAIDSVSFVQPEVKLQPNVIQMEKGLIDYLKSVDGMTLSFQSDIPAILKPASGTVLVCTTFDHPLFEEGFVGKVQRTTMSGDAYVVECDTVYDITEIFEQLIAIEKVYDEGSAAEVKPLYAPHTWISNRIPVSQSLNYDGSNFKISGSLEGSYIATVTWNITPGEEQFMDVRVNHDWQFTAGLNFHTDEPSFFKKGTVWVGPAIRFPTALPVFKFQLLGSPFVRGSGQANLDISLRGPTHSFLLTGSLRNGKFSGWKNNPVGNGADSKPSFDAGLSLNGFVQGGYMVEFYLGTIKCLGYAKASIDCYLGPKLSGNFTMEVGTDKDVSYYNTFKDSKLSLDLLSLDIEAYGEAAYLKQKPMRHTFFTASFPSPFQHSWYLMPDFSDLEVEKNEEELSATIACTPQRDILFPLGLGLGVYDEEDNLVESKFESQNYKHENEGFQLKQTFKSLKNNKPYTARPMVRIFGSEIPASPTEEFKIEKFPVTLSDFKVTKSQYKQGGFSNDGLSYDYRFDVSVKATLEADDLSQVADWGYVYLDPNGREKEISLRSFGTSYTDTRYAYFRNAAHSNCTLYGYVRYVGSDETVYGEPHDFELDYKGDNLCPDDHHPHMIDLGIGTLWSCCNVGASAPEQYGNYYAWGETSPKSVYNWDTYQYGRAWDDVDYIGSDISGTSYDAARANWGAPWRMPTLAECKALVNCSSEWTTLNGVYGRKFTGPNGGSIFLPAAGYRWDGELRNAGSGGYYWSSTLYESLPGGAYYFYFYSGSTSWDVRRYGRSVRPVR